MMPKQPKVPVTNKVGDPDLHRLYKQAMADCGLAFRSELSTAYTIHIAVALILHKKDKQTVKDFTLIFNDSALETMLIVWSRTVDAGTPDAWINPGEIASRIESSGQQILEGETFLQIADSALKALDMEESAARLQTALLKSEYKSMLVRGRRAEKQTLLRYIKALEPLGLLACQRATVRKQDSITDVALTEKGRAVMRSILIYAIEKSVMIDPAPATAALALLDRRSRAKRMKNAFAHATRACLIFASFYSLFLTSHLSLWLNHDRDMRLQLAETYSGAASVQAPDRISYLDAKFADRLTRLYGLLCNSSHSADDSGRPALPCREGNDDQRVALLTAPSDPVYSARFTVFTISAGDTNTQPYPEAAVEDRTGCRDASTVRRSFYDLSLHEDRIQQCTKAALVAAPNPDQGGNTAQGTGILTAVSYKQTDEWKGTMTFPSEWNFGEFSHKGKLLPSSIGSAREANPNSKLTPGNADEILRRRRNELLSEANKKGVIIPIDNNY